MPDLPDLTPHIIFEDAETGEVIYGGDNSLRVNALRDEVWAARLNREREEAEASEAEALEADADAQKKPAM